MVKSANPSQYACHNDILNVLLHADAVTCNGNVDCHELMTRDSKVLYKIPSEYQVTIDYNKIAKALYDAGYRKVVRND